MNNFTVDFFIAGAPKCGTSSLAHYLSQHPHVCFSTPKEPGYFAVNHPESRLTVTEKEYRKTFACSSKHKQINGEGSTIYLYSGSAFKEIMAHNPKARVIVMLRNPVELAYSLFLQLRHTADEQEFVFIDAWNKFSERKKHTPGKSLLLYKDVVSLGSQVRELLATVPEKQVFIGFLEDFKLNPPKTYKKILDFLNLPDDNRKEFEVINSSGDHRNIFAKHLFLFVTKNRTLYMLAIKVVRQFRIPNWLVNSIHKSPAKKIEKFIPSEVRKSIAQELENEVKILSSLVNRDLSLIWKDFK